MQSPNGQETSLSPYIGSDLCKRTVNEFSFGHWIADPKNDHVEPHGHELAHLMWAMTGSYVTAAKGERSAELDPIVFNPAQTFHSDRFEGPRAYFFVLEFDGALFQHGDEVGLPDEPVLITGNHAVASLQRLAAECFSWEVDSFHAAENCCYEAVAALGRREPRERRAPKWLNHACDGLRQTNGSETSIRRLAQDVGVHPTHFVRMFRSVLGCTPTAYGRRFRVRRAADMLQLGRKPIAEIALACGFSDQSHLTRRFREAFGVTPGVFRRSIQG